MTDVQCPTCAGTGSVPGDRYLVRCASCGWTEHAPTSTEAQRIGNEHLRTAHPNPPKDARGISPGYYFGITQTATPIPERTPTRDDHP